MSPDEHEYRRDIDQIGGNYGIVAGDYSQPWKYLIDLVPQSNEVPVSQEELGPLETFFADYLEKQLALKNGDPVIALDIGGFVGLSWIKLAKHFEQEIREGKIAFVVSNLNYDPHGDLSYVPNLTTDQRRFITENSQLVHFHNATASQLNNIILTLPNGKQVGLNQNVDLVHENASLTLWSVSPDIDIPEVGKLLSSIGAYFIPKADISTAIYKKQIETGHKALKRQGLRQISKLEQGILRTNMKYVVFRKPKAPKITLDN